MKDDPVRLGGHGSICDEIMYNVLIDRAPRYMRLEILVSLVSTIKSGITGTHQVVSHPLGLVYRMSSTKWYE